MSNKFIKIEPNQETTAALMIETKDINKLFNLPAGNIWKIKSVFQQTLGGKNVFYVIETSKGEVYSINFYAQDEDKQKKISFSKKGECAPEDIYLEALPFCYGVSNFSSARPGIKQDQDLVEEKTEEINKRLCQARDNKWKVVRMWTQYCHGMNNFFHLQSVKTKRDVSVNIYTNRKGQSSVTDTFSSIKKPSAIYAAPEILKVEKSIEEITPVPALEEEYIARSSEKISSLLNSSVKLWKINQLYDIVDNDFTYACYHLESASGDKTELSTLVFRHNEKVEEPVLAESSIIPAEQILGKLKNSPLTSELWLGQPEPQPMDQHNLSVAESAFQKSIKKCLPAIIKKLKESDKFPVSTVANFASEDGPAFQCIKNPNKEGGYNATTHYHQLWMLYDTNFSQIVAEPITMEMIFSQSARAKGEIKVLTQQSPIVNGNEVFDVSWDHAQISINKLILNIFDEQNTTINFDDNGDVIENGLTSADVNITNDSEKINNLLKKSPETTWKVAKSQKRRVGVSSETSYEIVSNTLDKYVIKHKSAPYPVENNLEVCHEGELSDNLKQVNNSEWKEESTCNLEKELNSTILCSKINCLVGEVSGAKYKVNKAWNKGDQKFLNLTSTTGKNYSVKVADKKGLKKAVIIQAIHGESLPN